MRFLQINRAPDGEGGAVTVTVEAETPPQLEAEVIEEAAEVIADSAVEIARIEAEAEVEIAQIEAAVEIERIEAQTEREEIWQEGSQEALRAEVSQLRETVETLQSLVGALALTPPMASEALPPISEEPQVEAMAEATEELAEAPSLSVNIPVAEPEAERVNRIRIL